MRQGLENRPRVGQALSVYPRQRKGGNSNRYGCITRRRVAKVKGSSSRGFKGYPEDPDLRVQQSGGTGNRVKSEVPRLMLGPVSVEVR